MKVQFIGTGVAGALNNWQTNALITFDSGDKLLIDCGGDGRHAMRAAGVKPSEINNVYISHLHGDHCGGLEDFGFATYFDPKCRKPNLYISRALVSDLWNNVLSGGMSTLQNEVNSLETYYDVHPVEKNGGFVIDGVSFTLVQVMHIMSGFTFMLSFGLMAMMPTGKKIFFTTDTQFAPAQIMDFYRSADVIFHDCECYSGFKSGVHAHFDDLATLSPEIKAKMHMVHYPDLVVDNWDDWARKAQEAGFAEFVPTNKVYEF
jgi:ribonuclease BN (tRNA processing enzyme)